MFTYSRGASLLLAISIAAVTTAFLSLFEDVPNYALAAAFFLCFGVSYILTTVALEFFIFREINKINKALDLLKNEELSMVAGATKTRISNPFRKINDEIYTYAALKQREIEELKKLAAFRREFVADVSHELKTPVFAAQGFVLTLLDGAIKDKNVRIKFLKKAAKSLEGLEMLLDDLLTISQMETGEIRMKLAPFDIYEITREVIDQLESSAEEKSILINLIKTAERLMVIGDSQRIYQVMTNLISNAIKYSKPGGKVAIYFKVGKNNVTISVQDNGIGIPQQDIKRIFERFYRVEKSRSKEQGGTGLGLAIVKHILEAHHSKVAVESVQGEGSVFSFKLKKAAHVKPDEAETR